MVWAPDYVSVAEAKAFLRVTDTVDDTELALIVTAASRAIDTATNRQFGVVASPELRYYSARWDVPRRRWVVEIDDLMTTTSFDPQIQDSTGTNLGAATYTLEPRNAAAKGKPWTHLVVKTDSTYQPTGLEYECAFTGSWGWTAVPSTVKTAGRLQVNRFLSRRDSPYGVAGSPSEGSELRLLSRLDPDVKLMLASYVRWWAAA